MLLVTQLSRPLKASGVSVTGKLRAVLAMVSRLRAARMSKLAVVEAEQGDSAGRIIPALMLKIADEFLFDF